MTDRDKRLAEIQERCEKATNGPWKNRYDRAEVTGANWEAWMPIIVRCVPQRGSNVEHFNNGDFIANSRDDIRFLLAEIERLKLELELWARKYATQNGGL